MSERIEAVSGDAAINGAILSLLAGYRGETKPEAMRVATVLRAAKESADARKGTQAGIFGGMLDLIGMGATPGTVQAVGAELRREVAGELRVAAGFTRYKLKGAKETGAPDFSTGSVYAKLGADSIIARAMDLPTWQLAMETVRTETEEGRPVHEASGFFATVTAARKCLAEFQRLQEEREAARFPALQASQDALSRAELERQNGLLRGEVDTLKRSVASALQGADADGSLKQARTERDAMQAELIAAHAELAAMRRTVDSLTAQLTNEARGTVAEQ